MMNDNIKIVELSSYTAPEIKEDKRNEWVNYGDENNYFEFLIDRYRNSTTNNAIINNISRLVYGYGVGALDGNRKPNEYAQFMSMFSKDDVRKLVLELKMLGQCALQVHYSKDRKTVKKVFHIPVHLLRPEKCNKDGEIEAYYYSDDWSDIKTYVPKKLDAFGFGSKDVEILYVQPYSVGMKYFANVDYMGALPYAVLEEEVSDYLINLVQTGFSAQKLINFNNGSGTPEQQAEIYRSVTNKLTGSKGAKLIVSFNDNKEASTTIDDIPLNDAPEHYQYLSEECLRKIMLGHNVTSPLLFGIASTNGFSSNADELKNSFVLFDNMVIRPMQETLCDAFDKILAYNGISLNLYFQTLKPLEFDERGVKDENQNDVEMSSHFDLDTFLADLGEPMEQDGWIVLDERDVELEDEETLNNHLAEMNEEFEAKLNKESLLSKAVKFVSTGTARPTARSSQDKLVKDKFFKVRYKYTGNKSPERSFCKAMMTANKLYRKEDIDKMSSQPVNKGLGEFGSDTYDIFKYKGGARCSHKWQRVTMMLDINQDSNEFKEIGTRAAEIKGFKVTNPFEVSIYPKNLPLKGFSPNNKNLPKDVK
jgi:hypothetical protein